MRDVFMMANMKTFELDLNMNQDTFKEFDELLLNLQPVSFATQVKDKIRELRFADSYVVDGAVKYTLENTFE